MSCDSFSFDIIGLSEIYKIHENVSYDYDGYNFEYKTRSDNDDGRGGVALYVKDNITYTVRQDLSVFNAHVIESLFIEIKLSKQKSIVVGVIYRPNTAPLADVDSFIRSINDVVNTVSLENKHLM